MPPRVPYPDNFRKKKYSVMVMPYVGPNFPVREAIACARTNRIIASR